MEQRSLRGEVVVQILWDVEKYFDSLDVGTLIERAQHHAFPKEILELGLQAQRAPRIITVAQTYADALPRSGKSIIAGCSAASDLVEAYYAEPYRAVLERWRQQSCFSFLHWHRLSPL